MLEVTTTDALPSLLQRRPFYRKRSPVHIDPLCLDHTDMVAALRTIDILPLPDGMITGDSGLPAVEQASFSNLLVAKEFCSARGAVDGDHEYTNVCRLDKSLI